MKVNVLRLYKFLDICRNICYYDDIKMISNRISRRRDCYDDGNTG